jgi:hypothetical protein
LLSRLSCTGSRLLLQAAAGGLHRLPRPHGGGGRRTGTASSSSSSPSASSPRGVGVLLVGTASPRSASSLLLRGRRILLRHRDGRRRSRDNLDFFLRKLPSEARRPKG